MFYLGALGFRMNRKSTDPRVRLSELESRSIASMLCVLGLVTEPFCATQ